MPLAFYPLAPPKLAWPIRMTHFSFLCTFIPRSEKSTDGIFVPVELSLLGLSFLQHEYSKNFRYNCQKNDGKL